MYKASFVSRKLSLYMCHDVLWKALKLKLSYFVNKSRSKHAQQSHRKKKRIQINLNFIFVCACVIQSFLEPRHSIK